MLFNGEGRILIKKNCIFLKDFRHTSIGHIIHDLFSMQMKTVHAYFVANVFRVV